MSKFKNKYRNESARAPWWDYGNAAAYFITICTKNREHFFGEINDGKMILSPTGVIADLLWHEIPNHAKNVALDAFVVMPNHIHGILILNEKTNDNSDGLNDLDGCIDLDGYIGLDGHIVGTGHALSLQYDVPPQQQYDVPSPQYGRDDFMNDFNFDPNSFGNNDPENNYHPRFRNPGKNTVSSIIGGYKSAVTKHANRLGLENGWQTRFHDHIIRDDVAYQRIKNYILNNVSNWKQDKFH